MGDSCCGKSIEVAALQRRQRRVLSIVLAINASTFLMMVVGSLRSSSSALLSGGLDNLGDAATYAASLAVVGASLQAKARVALLKGALILAAAVGVAMQLGWRVAHPAVPLFEAMGVFGLVNLGANAVCLWLLTPHRSGDVNLASAWECSRNDVVEGLLVIVAAASVWIFDAQWPDLVVGALLLLVFLRSALRVFGAGLRELRAP